MKVEVKIMELFLWLSMVGIWYLVFRKVVVRLIVRVLFYFVSEMLGVGFILLFILVLLKVILRLLKC